MKRRSAAQAEITNEREMNYENYEEKLRGKKADTGDLNAHRIRHDARHLHIRMVHDE